MIKQYHKSSISLLDCKILAVDKDLSNQVEDADRAGDTIKLEVTCEGDARLIFEDDRSNQIIHVIMEPDTILAMARYLAWAIECVDEDEEDEQ